MNARKSRWLHLAVTTSLFAGCTIQTTPAPDYPPPQSEPPRNPRPADPAPAQPPPPQARPLPQRPRLRHEAPVVCTGNQSLRLVNVQIEAQQDAITADGNCRIEIVDSVLLGSRYAIRVGGKAVITVMGSELTGNRAAVRMGKAATLIAQNSIFNGDFEQLDARVNFIDRGNVTWNGSVRVTPLGAGNEVDVPPAPPPARPSRPLPPSPNLRRMNEVVCSGNQTQRLTNVIIETQNDAITADGNCRLEIVGSQIIANHYGMRVGGKATIVVRDSVVQGNKAAVRMGKAAQLSAQNTTFNGDFERLGGPETFRDMGGVVWNGSIRAENQGPTSRPPVEPAPAQPSLRRMNPVVCGGNETMRLAKVIIETDNDGITADGNCRIELIDSQIIAGHYGMRIGGKANITVTRSTVQGRKAAVRMGKAALITAQSSTFNGDFERLGGPETFRDRGSVVWNGSIRAEGPDVVAPAPAPAPPAGLRRMNAVTCTGNQTLRLAKVLIETDQDGITAEDNCRIELIDSQVIAGRYGMRVGGKANITVNRSTVQGSRAAIRMGKAAILTAQNSTFNGDFERLGGPETFRDRGKVIWNGSIRAEAGETPAPAPANPGPVPANPAPANPAPAQGGLRTIEPVKCKGNETLRLERVLIDAPGDAITAEGNCNLELIDSRVSAGRYALVLGGKSTVTVRGSDLSGTKGSVRMGKASSLSAQSTTFRGAFERLGGADTIRDLGGNNWGGPSPASAQNGAAQPSGPYTCNGTQTLRLDSLQISSNTSGVTVQGNCNVVISNSEIVASEYGIVLRGRGVVTVTQSKVQGARGAVSLNDFATLSAEATTFRGGLVRTAQATFRDSGGNKWLNGGIVGPQAGI